MEAQVTIKKDEMKRAGFTLVELLVVIVVLAILMAIALPLYLRSVRESKKRTCRGNMQVIAHAEQAFKIRDRQHQYTDNISQLVGTTQDLPALPRCPTDSGADITNDYTVTTNPAGAITVRCASDDEQLALEHNTVGDDTDHGYTPGLDGE